MEGSFTSLRYVLKASRAQIAGIKQKCLILCSLYFMFLEDSGLIHNTSIMSTILLVLWTSVCIVNLPVTSREEKSKCDFVQSSTLALCSILSAI